MKHHDYDMNPHHAPPGTTWVNIRPNSHEDSFMWIRLDSGMMLHVYYDGTATWHTTARQYVFVYSHNSYARRRGDIVRFDVGST